MFQYISNDNLTAILNPLNYVGDVNSTNHLLVCKSWRSAIRASPWDEAAKVIQHIFAATATILNPSWITGSHVTSVTGSW
jgi:hypothetical protein